MMQIEMPEASNVACLIASRLALLAHEDGGLLSFAEKPPFSPVASHTSFTRIMREIRAFA